MTSPRASGRRWGKATMSHVGEGLRKRVCLVNSAWVPDGPPVAAMLLGRAEGHGCRGLGAFVSAR